MMSCPRGHMSRQILSVSRNVDSNEGTADGSTIYGNKTIGSPIRSQSKSAADQALRSVISTHDKLVVYAA